MEDYDVTQEELIEFLTNMPSSVRELVYRFPPMSTVKAVGYQIPSPMVGSLGYVISYTVPTEEDPEGLVYAMDEWPPNAGLKGALDPARISLVSCGKITQDQVKTIIRKLAS
jgi:hypothetical protein